MKFTGNEHFPVQRGNRTVQMRLADMTGHEILEMANVQQQACDHEAARALFAYQAQRREMEAELAQMTATQINALLAEVRRSGDPWLLGTLRASLARIATGDGPQAA